MGGGGYRRTYSWLGKGASCCQNLVRICPVSGFTQAILIILKFNPSSLRGKRGGGGDGGGFQGYFGWYLVWITAPHNILYTVGRKVWDGRRSKGKGAREIGGRILGSNLDKSLKSFPPCYSQSPILKDFTTPPPPLSKSAWYETVL